MATVCLTESYRCRTKTYAKPSRLYSMCSSVFLRIPPYPWYSDSNPGLPTAHKINDDPFTFNDNGGSNQTLPTETPWATGNDHKTPQESRPLRAAIPAVFHASVAAPRRRAPPVPLWTSIVSSKKRAASQFVNSTVH